MIAIVLPWFNDPCASTICDGDGGDDENCLRQHMVCVCVSVCVGFCEVPQQLND